MSAEREAQVTPALLERILALAGTEMILVGGQALAFWSVFYQTPSSTLAITMDVDLLGRRADVERLARGLGAKAVFPQAKDRTALVGQIKKELPDGGTVNIDVLHRVHGDITVRAISARAVSAATGAGGFLVMHPLDVLQGRLENVYGLTAKQDEHGLAQLELAIAMTRDFLRSIGSQEGARLDRAERPVTLRHLARIEALALSDAGRKVAQRHHLHIADAIEPDPVGHLETFTTKKLPQLLKLMSPARRAEVLDSLDAR